MYTGGKLIQSVFHFIPMLFFSLMLFRLRIKPYWRQISLAVLAGSTLTADNPLLFTCIISILLMVVWKYRLVPALLISLSGFILSTCVSTIVNVCINLSHPADYVELINNHVVIIVAVNVAILAKFGVLFILYKMRLGFTFLSNYTRIPFNLDNAGVYLFIAVVLVGMVYRHSYPGSVFNVAMPIQMLSMAMVLFLYTMLGKELGIQR